MDKVLVGRQQPRSLQKSDFVTGLLLLDCRLAAARRMTGICLKCWTKERKLVIVLPKLLNGVTAQNDNLARRLASAACRRSFWCALAISSKAYALDMIDFLKGLLLVNALNVGHGSGGRHHPAAGG